MTPETVPPSDAQPKGMSEAARLAGVFFEPKKAFADIAARPRWIVPLLLVVVFAICSVTIYNQKGVMRATVEQQLANNQQIQQLSADQRAQAVDRAMRFSTIVAYFIPVLIPIMFLLMALVLWGIVAGILSAPVRFGQVFAVVAYAQLPGIIVAILSVIVLQMKGAADFNAQNPLMFNPGAFMDPQNSSKFLLSLATSLDLFTFWIILLIATGLKAAAGKKLSFGGAFFAVVLPWAILVLGKSALAGLAG
jgi:hypothetical protein